MTYERRALPLLEVGTGYLYFMSKVELHSSLLMDRSVPTFDQYGKVRSIV